MNMDFFRTKSYFLWLVCYLRQPSIYNCQSCVIKHSLNQKSLFCQSILQLGTIATLITTESDENCLESRPTHQGATFVGLMIDLPVWSFRSVSSLCACSILCVQSARSLSLVTVIMRGRGWRTVRLITTRYNTFYFRCICDHIPH